MTAYVLLLREGPVRDTAEMNEYLRKLGENPVDPKLMPLALYGALEFIEGRPADGVVLLQFPTVEDAKAWYFSPAYQAAAAHRIKAADYRVMIVQGI